MESATLCIRLLGGFDLRLGEKRLPSLESARAESLLAYLLIHRQTPQPRQHLAFVLWPDSTERQARTNLRHVLHLLRRALPDLDRFVDVTPRTLQWRDAAAYWLDVAAFEEAVNRAVSESDEDDLAALQEAVELYTGDLLEASYDEWFLDERERLRQRYVATLERLPPLLEARRDHARAIQYAERLLRLDPLREETYRLLMRLHDARGDRARAVRSYHACAAALERELGVEPSQATRTAYEALLPPEREVSDGGQAADPVAGPPLVGREAERARLVGLWRETENGRARLVLVTGEPGIGKSRLVEELRSWCAHRGALTAQARSYPAEGDLTYGPVIAWLRAEPLRAGRGRLDRTRLTELARLLPELREESPDLPGAEPLIQGDQRQRLFDAIAGSILASGVPVLLVADDLQWCDRETLQFIHYLLRSEPEVPLMVAATARREEIDAEHGLNELVAGMRALDRVIEIELGRLTREETAALAERITREAVGEPDADRLFGDTEGNPLFVVEALRAGWGRDGAEPGWMTPRVQSVIESRLARLSEAARDLASAAATIGREFTSELLAAATETDPEALVGGLDELWRRRIVRDHGADAYDFSHDKIREVASLALSPAQRHHHHLRVARALERLHVGDPGPVSAQVASHYDRAGAAREAVPWYAKAAEEAQRVYAHVEAIRLLNRGLELVRALPDGQDRRERELVLLTALLAPLAAAEGFSSTRLIDAQRLASGFEGELGLEPAPPLLRSIALTSLARGEFDEARRVGEHLRARGEGDGDDVLAVEGLYVLGISAFWQGELGAARQHFEDAVDRYRPEHRATHLVRYGLDPQVVCLSRLGNTLWFLGVPGAAIRARDTAVTMAEEIGHPFTSATALVFAALLSFELRDEEGLRRYVGALETRAGDEEGKPNEVAREALAAYLDVLDGRADAGLARIRGELDDVELAQHAPGLRAWIARVLLEACVVSGDVEGGLAVTDLGLRTVQGVRLWEAETHRLRAEFLAALGAPHEQVEAELETALDIARGQGARALELRAATSLLRLKLEHGRSVGDARRLLAAILDGLPEGRDTPDAREAASLLARS